MKTLTTILVILDIALLVCLFGKSFVIGVTALIVVIFILFVYYMNYIAKELDSYDNI